MVEGIGYFEKEVLRYQAIWRCSPIVFLLCLSTVKLHRKIRVIAIGSSPTQDIGMLRMRPKEDRREGSS